MQQSFAHSYTTCKNFSSFKRVEWKEGFGRKEEAGLAAVLALTRAAAGLPARRLSVKLSTFNGSFHLEDTHQPQCH